MGLSFVFFDDFIASFTETILDIGFFKFGFKSLAQDVFIDNSKARSGGLSGFLKANYQFLMEIVFMDDLVSGFLVKVSRNITSAFSYAIRVSSPFLRQPF